MIQEIHIKNFRSIKEISLDVNSLSSFIGPNSSGKTNILKAIDLVLGEGWTTKAKVARELFNNPEKPIIIEIFFSHPIVIPEAANYCRDDLDVRSIKLEMQLNPELSATTTVNDGEKFYGHEKFKKLCHFIYIPSERRLSSELRVSQWTMLGKMMKLVYENYVAQYNNDEKRLKGDFKEKMVAAKEFLESDFSETEVTFKKFSDKFKEKCTQNSAGLASEFEPVLDIYNLNWFYKTLQIHVKEGFAEKHFDSEEVGAGMQNLLMISIFQTYAELMGGRVIFGIEEPEIYLYPQAQRSLYKSFIELSRNTQIFYTTHNPNFVDAARADDIVLLRKDFERGTYKLEKDDYFTSENAGSQVHKVYTHFNTERNEIFFAKKVILVEGDSDKILFSTLCEDKWNIDLDKEGISIISCGGKGGVIYFLGVCKLIGIENLFAIWDEDEDVENTGLLDEALSNNKGFSIEPNLESFLGLPDGDGAGKVKNAYNWASGVEPDAIPDGFNTVKNFCMEDVNETNNESSEESGNPLIQEIQYESDIKPEDLPF
jgi:putative ATP-dependent endonuclease of OLD family